MSFDSIIPTVAIVVTLVLAVKLMLTGSAMLVAFGIGGVMGAACIGVHSYYSRQVGISNEAV